MGIEDNLNIPEKSEVYWLLDNVLENLRVITQALYKKNKYSEVLLILSLLAFSDYNSIDMTEIEELIKKLVDPRWRDLNWTISFYLGVLARNYLTIKKSNTLPDTNEIANMFGEIHEKLREFHNDEDPEKTVNAIFLDTLALDIVTNMLNLDPSKFYTDTEFISNLIDEYMRKAPELPFEHRIKIAYSTLVFHSIFNKTIDYNYLRKLLHDLLNSLDKINIEHRTFMLRVLTSLHMIKERQSVLTSIVDEYKSRFTYVAEKTLQQKLLNKLVYDNQSEDVNFKHEENEEAKTLEFKLTEEQIENITVRPNITQLCLMALGFIISGYHKSYTLPLYEQRNYVNCTKRINELNGNNKVQERLLVLDRLELDGYITEFLENEVWPMFEKKLIYESIILIFSGIFIGLIDYYLINRGEIIMTAVIILEISSIIGVLLSIIHRKWLETLIHLIIEKEKLKDTLIESLREKIYKKYKK